MLFVVGIDEIADGKKVFVEKMGTDYPSCVKNIDVLKSMEQAGYRFKVNGKFVKAKEVWEIISRENTTDDSLNNKTTKRGKNNEK